jgi:transcriptional regulator with XRE-family HTH domain
MSGSVLAPRDSLLLDQQVGSRVRMRRLMLKLSQTGLTDGLGLTFQQVQKYEKGMNRIGAGPLAANRPYSASPGNFLLRDSLTSSAYGRAGSVAHEPK